MPKKVVIILAEGFEEIEAITPIDILRRSGIEVITASLNPQTKTVKGSHDILIQTDTSLDELTADFDACILPGGPGAKRLAESAPLKSLISAMHKDGKLIAAICAAPAIVLAPAGILDGKTATCYPDMENNFSSATTFSTDRVVVDGNVITSRGPGTALAFSLAIAETLVGKNTADKIKQKTVTA